jgi:DNA-binding MarR family transcriptional regulator/predicted N-acetyltransferase YhbS
MASMSSSSSALPARVDALRAFNRFYTRRIGVLHEGWAESKYSLTETRLLWEIAHAGNTTASSLARTLALDAGYLSRLLRGLRERGLVRSERSEDDARHVHLQLSAAGRRALAPLEARTRDETAALLATLSDAEQQRLLHALGTITQLLADPPRPAATPYLLRPPRAGDIGWVIARHGALYAQEYGWDARFEALAARIAADFVEHYDPTREACWIAERDGSNIGCVFLVQARDEASGAVRPGVAQLRMLLVEPSARGLGLGKRLVTECERFAREKGYERIVLWTNANLAAARGIYRQAGYVLTHSEPHHSFGHDLVGETWELVLR